MSSLFSRAKDAFRRIFQRRTTSRNEPPGGARSLPGPPPVQRRRDPPFTGQPSMPGAPPVNLPPIVQAPTSQELQDIREVEQVYTELQLFGRDRGFSDDMGAVMERMRRVSSSNVYGYYFELEKSQSGILYVTFLGQNRDGSRTDTPGTTYAYFDVPRSKFDQFQQASESSAGRAVWDYLRVRGSQWEHQHRYRLVQAHGDYIPRKVTRFGFKTRQLAPTGQPKIPNSVWSAISRLSSSDDPKIRNYAGEMKRYLLAKNQFRRSTLPPRSFVSRGTPNRGTPNRG
jgi:hypothetical protein